ncbi:MAG TPA: class I SAM-dependent methyltransferase [Candidatus Paceibacterota bacterium]
MQKQVEAQAYGFKRYVQIDRWASYYYQLSEILARQPASVLEVGVGDGVVGEYVRRSNIAYTSVDIAEDVKPDIIASVTAIPVPEASYDLACAFEVLEHLPFTEFDRALAELARVSCGTVIISLPHFGPPLRFSLKIPFLPELRIAWKIPYPRKHVFNGQHYWEIGKRGYPLRRIRRVIERHFVINKDFVPFENQYHHFFVLEKRPL